MLGAAETGHKRSSLGQGGALQTFFLVVLLFAPDDPIVHFVFEEGFGERARLGAVDLIDWGRRRRFGARCSSHSTCRWSVYV